MKKYVKCSVCGKPIYFGEKVLTKKYYVGVYCSPNCFANSFNIGCCETLMNEKLAWHKEVKVITDSVENDEKITKKQLYDLLYVIRTNLTSITRYVKHERSKHPNLTEGQFIDRHLEYKELASVAVDNILKYINGENKSEDTE